MTMFTMPTDERIWEIAAELELTEEQVRGVADFLARSNSEAYTIEIVDDYGVWDTVAVVVGPESRAREVADQRAEELGDPEVVSFDRVEVIR